MKRLPLSVHVSAGSRDALAELSSKHRLGIDLRLQGNGTWTINKWARAPVEALFGGVAGGFGPGRLFDDEPELIVLRRARTNATYNRELQELYTLGGAKAVLERILGEME